jgi:hypothetical protein
MDSELMAFGRWVLKKEWYFDKDRLRITSSCVSVTKSNGFPPHRMVPPKVRAFLDFAQKRFGKPPYWDLDWTEDRHKTSHDVTE